MYKLISYDVENTILNEFLDVKTLSKISLINKYYHIKIRRKLFNFYYFFNYWIVKRNIRNKIHPELIRLSLHYGYLDVFVYLYQSSSLSIYNFSDTFGIINYMVNCVYNDEIVNYLILNEQIAYSNNMILLDYIIKYNHRLLKKYENIFISLYSDSSLWDVLFFKSIYKNNLRSLIILIDIFTKTFNKEINYEQLYHRCYISHDLNVLIFYWTIFDNIVNIKQINMFYIKNLHDRINEYPNMSEIPIKIYNQMKKMYTQKELIDMNIIDIDDTINNNYSL